MYLLVRNVVSKCTERSEGVSVFKECEESLQQGVDIRVDFDGIINVSEDFVYGFLGQVAEGHNFKQICYVRIQSHILTKFKKFAKAVGC